jgi:hypothetical protein
MLSTKLAVCITVWFDGLHNGFRKFVLLNNLTDIAVDALLRHADGISNRFRLTAPMRNNNITV